MGNDINQHQLMIFSKKQNLQKDRQVIPRPAITRTCIPYTLLKWVLYTYMITRTTGTCIL